MFRLAFFLFLTTLMITKNVQSDPTVVSGKEITEVSVNILTQTSKTDLSCAGFNQSEAFCHRNGCTAQGTSICHH